MTKATGNAIKKLELPRRTRGLHKRVGSKVFAAAKKAYFDHLKYYRNARNAPKYWSYVNSNGDREAYCGETGFFAGFDLNMGDNEDVAVDIIFRSNGTYYIEGHHCHSCELLTETELETALNVIKMGNCEILSLCPSDLIYDGHGNVSCLVAMVSEK